MAFKLAQQMRNVFFACSAILITPLIPMTALADPFAYVTNSLSDTVSVIDIETNTVTTTVSVGSKPNDVAISPDGYTAYVANNGSDTVSVIDTATNTVGTAITVGGFPARVAISPDGLTAYVVNVSPGSVSVIDTATNQVTATVIVEGFPFGVAVSRDGHTIYVTNANSNNVSVIDTATNTETTTISVGNTPLIIAISPDGNTAYVANYRSDTLSVIDTTTNTVTKTISVGENPFDIAISPDGLTAYIAYVESNFVSVIDTATHQVIANIAIESISGSTGVAISPDGSSAYVMFAGSNLGTVSVIDTTTHQVTTNIVVGALPSGIAITPETNNEKPTANAGLDLAFRAGDTVALDGGSSFDDNTSADALVYSWEINVRPEGSTTALAGADTATPSFIADIAGDYQVSLVVTDEGGLASDADTINISSDNLAPTAAAGNDQLVIIGTNVGLDGGASDDPEADDLTYNWVLTTPEGSLASLEGATSAAPSFTPDLEGSYAVELTVSDFLGAGVPDSVDIVAASAGGFAEIQIVETSDVILALPETEVTTTGNQTAAGNFLRQAMLAIQDGDTETAIDKLEKSIERTDGCALRGSPDSKGKGRDWITSCNEQAPVYAALTDALNALTQ